MQLSSLLNKQNATAGVVATVVSAATLGVGLWDRNVGLATGEVQRITSLQERLTSQQRQIDEIKTLVADVRKEFLTEGSSQNKLAIALQDRKLGALSERLDGLPIGLSGGVNTKALETAVQAAENRITQRVSVQIGGLVDGAVSKAVENQVASLPTATGNDVPIATVRKIHIATKECVYLPSMGQQFTLKFRNGTEFCWKPSVLWFDVSRTQGNYFEFRYAGGPAYGCKSGKTCYIGEESDGTRYKLHIEKNYETDGVRFFEVNFQKVS